MALLGGETAEMPGMYAGEDYDLAGFSVGLVAKRDVIDGSKIFAGDIVLGLPSSGLHSNGFSLVRKVFSPRTLKSKAQGLLTPTRIYVKPILSLLTELRKRGHIVLGMAHITGGGFAENFRRILPNRCQADFDLTAWDIPPIFNEIQTRGKISEREMWKTFNMGIGLAIVLRPDSVDLARSILPDARIIGSISAGKRNIRLNGVSRRGSR